MDSIEERIREEGGCQSVGMLGEDSLDGAATPFMLYLSDRSDDGIYEAEYGLMTDDSFLMLAHVTGYKTMIEHMLDCALNGTERTDLLDRNIYLEAVAPLAAMLIAGKEICCHDFDAQRILAEAQQQGIRYDSYHSVQLKLPIR